VKNDTQSKMTSGYRTFLIVWMGQVVSIVGSGLTWFGISIWVFLETGSVTQLAVILLSSQLPRIVLSPIAGTYVDRWDRRWAMILADAGAGAGTLVMVALYLTDNLSLPALATIAAVSGAFQAFQFPAYQAATSLLVPKERYSQASGMIQLAEAIGNLIAPALGGIMIAVGGLGLLVAIDMPTFLFAVATLLAVRFPKTRVTEAGAASKGSVWHETAYGFKYIYDRKGLFGLLIYFAAVNLAFGAISPLITAYLLSITTAATMGALFSLGATGMIVGSVLASTWRGVRRKVPAILALGAVLGAAVRAVGMATSLPLIVMGILGCHVHRPVGRRIQSGDLDGEGRTGHTGSRLRRAFHGLICSYPDQPPCGGTARRPCLRAADDGHVHVRALASRHIREWRGERMRHVLRCGRCLRHRVVRCRMARRADSSP